MLLAISECLIGRDRGGACARVGTVCMMAAYILAFIVETREYSYRTTPGRDRYTPFPGFAWITGTIAGALWVIAGSAGCCAPPRDVQGCERCRSRRDCVH